MNLSDRSCKTVKGTCFLMLSSTKEYNKKFALLLTVPKMSGALMLKPKCTGSYRIALCCSADL